MRPDLEPGRGELGDLLRVQQREPRRARPGTRPVALASEPPGDAEHGGGQAAVSQDRSGLARDARQAVVERHRDAARRHVACSNGGGDLRHGEKGGARVDERVELLCEQLGLDREHAAVAPDPVVGEDEDGHASASTCR